MKPVILIGICSILISCNQANNNFTPTTRNVKSIHIPDSSNWYSKIFDYPNYLEKNQLSKKLKLNSLESDSIHQEIRVWVLNSIVDPKLVYLIKGNKSNCTISKINYYSRYRFPNNEVKDSIHDITKSEKKINEDQYELLGLNKIWNLQSQSEMKNGGKYGCMDGYSLLIELNTPSAYKFLFYQCPDMHVSKDSTFYFAQNFTQTIAKLWADGK